MKIALVAQHLVTQHLEARHTLLLDNCAAEPDAEDVLTRELAIRLAASGHEVTLYVPKQDCAQPDRARVAAGVHVEHLGTARDGGSPGATADEHDLLARVPAFAGPLRARLSADRPDVVHALRWTSGLAALAASRGLGIPVVQSFHSLGIAERRHRLIPQTAGTERIRLEPAIGRSVSAVLAGSSDEESDLARLGVPRRSIKVVPCAVDTAEFAPEGPAEARNGRSRLITVAEMEGATALDTLLRAMAKVPGTELIVAGGPPRDQLHAHPEHARRCALASSLGLAGRVLFTGRLEEGHLPRLLRSADLFIAASEYEPSAMLSLQAMACGTPVVAPAAGGQADAVLDGTTGILVPPGRPALLARRIRELLAHPMLLQAFSVAAADRARSRYSWERITRETVAVYDQAVDAAAA